jgi:dephospho-CoA kinase
MEWKELCKTIIGIVGMPGSGKGIVSDVADDLGLNIVVMGDVIRNEVVHKGLEPTSENIGKIMLKMRSKYGSAIVAKRCVPKILSSTNRFVLVDGIRSFDEVEEFKRRFPNFFLIAIYSSPKTRFRRIFKRNRSDDPDNWKIFYGRDAREIGVGIGKAIALADFMIINEQSIAKFRSDVKKLLKSCMI